MELPFDRPFGSFAPKVPTRVATAEAVLLAVTRLVPLTGRDLTACSGSVRAAAQLDTGRLVTRHTALHAHTPTQTVQDKVTSDPQSEATAAVELDAVASLDPLPGWDLVAQLGIMDPVGATSLR